MKIEEGNFYKTRDGRRVGPMKRTDCYGTDWIWTVEENFAVDGVWGKAWKANGSYSAKLGEPEEITDGDLVCEWGNQEKSPVRVRSVKEIVPGQYGKVTVKWRNTEQTVGNTVTVGICLGDAWCIPLNSNELRAAATTLVELAEYLEQKE